MTEVLDNATLAVLLHAHREDFLSACEQQGMNDGDARELLANFEHESRLEQEDAA